MIFDLNIETTMFVLLGGMKLVEYRFGPFTLIFGQFYQRKKCFMKKKKKEKNNRIRRLTEKRVFRTSKKKQKKQNRLALNVARGNIM